MFRDVMMRKAYDAATACGTFYGFDSALRAKVVSTGMQSYLSRRGENSKAAEAEGYAQEEIGLLNRMARRYDVAGSIA